MKKTILAAIILMAMTVTAIAQPRAVGGRVGWGLEASYQHNLGDNMLQIDAGLPGFYLGIQATGTYNWIFPISSWKHSGEWNWYAGVGAGLGCYWDSFFIGAAGQVGVEYNFDFPLQLSLDYRPIIGPYINGGGAGFNFSGIYGGFGVSARYRF